MRIEGENQELRLAFTCGVRIDCEFNAAAAAATFEFKSNSKACRGLSNIELYPLQNSLQSILKKKTKHKMSKEYIQSSNLLYFFLEL